VKIKSFRPLAGWAAIFVGAGMAATFFASPLRAAEIPVFSTGVDSSGNPLPSGATDPHYTDMLDAGTANFGQPYNPSLNSWFSPPNYPPVAYVGTSSVVNPVTGPNAGNNPFWNADVNPGARAIFFNNPANPGASGDQGVIFETTFDLTGFDPSTASITLRYVMDDWGDVGLNGVLDS
jgi:hypothetical protein